MRWLSHQYSHARYLICLLLMLFGSTITLKGVKTVNIYAKERAIKRLVNWGSTILRKKGVARACNEFKQQFWGETFAWLIGEDGTCYVFGDEVDRIWTDFSTLKDVMTVPLMTRLLKAGVKGDWVAFPLNNMIMHAYVQNAVKDGITYVVGAGFYPEEPSYQVYDLVKRALDTLSETAFEDAITMFSDPYGFFVRGASYIIMLDVDGTILANGDDRGLIGQDFFKMYGPRGDLINSEREDRPARYLSTQVKKFIKSNASSRWLSSEIEGASVRMLVRKYIHPVTQKRYVVASLFYPNTDDDAVHAFVQKAAAFMKAEGEDKALKEFNQQVGQFLSGGMTIFVYTPDGLCLADGEENSNVGHTTMGKLDEQGRYTMKKMIRETLNNGHAWVTIRDKHAFKLLYAERIELPEGTRIIGSGFWPTSKSHTVKAMVDRAIGLLADVDKDDALQRFTSFDSDFLRGDIVITAYDPRNGITLVDGPYRKYNIWKDMALRDARGRKIITRILDTAAQGGGWVTYKQNHARYRQYVYQVEVTHPNGTTEDIVITAGYYPVIFTRKPL